MQCQCVRDSVRVMRLENEPCGDSVVHVGDLPYILLYISLLATMDCE